jgi:hypothetical protein
MPKFKRKPGIIEAVQWFSDKKIDGVEIENYGYYLFFGTK